MSHSLELPHPSVLYRVSARGQVLRKRRVSRKEGGPSTARALVLGLAVQSRRRIVLLIAQCLTQQTVICPPIFHRSLTTIATLPHRILITQPYPPSYPYSNRRLTQLFCQRITSSSPHCWPTSLPKFVLCDKFAIFSSNACSLPNSTSRFSPVSVAAREDDCAIVSADSFACDGEIAPANAC